MMMSLAKKFFIIGTAFVVFGVKAYAEDFIQVRADRPSLKYFEGDRASFSIFEKIVPDSKRFKLAVEAFYPDEQHLVRLAQIGPIKYFMTPPLVPGVEHLILKVYLEDVMMSPVPSRPNRVLVQTKDIQIKTRIHDTTPPTMGFLPEPKSDFITDMPAIQINFSDSESGIDRTSFKCKLIDVDGKETDISSLFDVSSNFATIQFDERHKLPAGQFFLKASIADFNENVTESTVFYMVRIEESSEGYIAGEVKDPSGQPVSGAHVRIVSGGVIGRDDGVYSDERGKYLLPVGQGGEFLIVAEKLGWTSQNKRVQADVGRDSAVEPIYIKQKDPVVTFIPKELGGIGVNKENTVEFHVAPGAASQSINLNITQNSAGKELPGPLPMLSQFTYEGEMQPSGTTFSPAGNLRVKNTRGFPPGAEIVFGIYDELKGLWKDAGSGQVTADGSYIEYPLAHFSSWDGNQPNVPPTDLQPNVASGKTGDQLGQSLHCPGCRIDMETGNLLSDYSLPAVMRYGKSYAPTFTYRSQSSKPVAFVSMDQNFKNYSFFDVPDLVRVKLYLAGVYQDLFYKGSGTYAGKEVTYSYRFLKQAKDIKGDYLKTGRYHFDANVGNDYKNSKYATAAFFGAPAGTKFDVITAEPVSLLLSVNSDFIVLNSRNSAFGNGWTLQGLEKIYFQSGRDVVWEDGSGKATLYKYIPERSAPSFLVNKIDSMRLSGLSESSGALYIADCEGNVIRRVGIDGNAEVIAGTGQAGFSGENDLAINAKLNCPTSVTVDNNGEILIADTNNMRIRKITKSGYIVTVAGNGQGSEGSDGAIARETGIGRVRFVSQDKLDSIHFIVGNRVRFVDPRGKIRTMLSEGGEGYFKASLNNPSQVSYDEYDNLIVTDTGNNRVIKLFLQTGDVRILVGNQIRRGRERVSRALGSASSTEIVAPLSYVQDRKRHLAYILESTGNIKILNSSGDLLKTSLKAKGRHLFLTKSGGMIGLSNGMPGQYDSPASDFSIFGEEFSIFSRTSPDGVRSTFNNDGLIVERINLLNGQKESYVYDSQKRPIQWILPDGSKYTFSYSLRGYLSSVKDPAGRITNFDLDSSGHLVQITNPAGGQRKFAYNDDLLVQETDENNKSHQYVYNSAGLISKEIYSDGSVRQIKPMRSLVLVDEIPAGTGTFDNPAPLPEIQDTVGSDTTPEGRTWFYATDKWGRITKSTDALGRSTVYTADPQTGQNIRSVTSGGLITSSTYDRAFPTSITTEGRTTNFEYLGYGLPKKITDGMGKVTTFTYSRFNLTSIKNPLSQETKFEYNAYGLPTSVTDALGNKTLFEYNTLGLLSAHTDALGNRTAYKYNDAGLLQEVTDVLGRKTSYEYDSNNRVTKILDPIGKSTLMSYSSGGDLLSITDAKGQVTTYTYNDRGWLASTSNALGQVEFFQYDRDGLLTKKIKRDGTEISYVYNQGGELIKKVLPDKTIEYSYDLGGYLKQVTTPTSVVKRTLSSSGLLQSELQGDFYTNYSYNRNRQRLDFGSKNLKQHYSYNGGNVLDEITANINQKDFVWNRELDALGRPTVENLPNGLQVLKEYTALSQLASLTNRLQDGNVLSGFNYAYDDVGRRTVKDELNGGFRAGVYYSQNYSSNYSYDRLDRLVGATQPSEAFSYDEVGNSQFGGAAQYNPLNQLLQLQGRYRYEYSLNGEITKRYDLQTGETRDYIWDAEGQLVEILMKKNGNLAKDILFDYDGLGRRISKQVIDSVNSERSYARKFFYDGVNIVEEQDGAGGVIANYFHGPGIDEPLLVDRTEGTFTYTRDGIGSVKEMTKLDQSLKQRYHYSAYGVTSQELADNPQDRRLVENRFAYTGRELDEETGLYYYRARYYDPELGRFISEDPLRYGAGQPSFYSYVGGHPINARDPSGKIEPVTAIALVIILPAITQGTASGLTTYLTTGSVTESASAFVSGTISGAAAGASVAAAFAFGVEATAVAVAVGVATDLGITIANATDVLPGGGISDFSNGISAILNPKRFDFLDNDKAVKPEDVNSNKRDKIKCP